MLFKESLGNVNQMSHCEKVYGGRWLCKYRFTFAKSYLCTEVSLHRGDFTQLCLHWIIFTQGHLCTESSLHRIIFKELKDSVQGKVCKNDFNIVIFVKIMLQKMTVQILLCAKMTLYKDDHVQTQLNAKSPLCKNNSLHKWLLCKEDFAKKTFQKDDSVQRWIYAKITLGKDDPAKSSLCKDDSLQWLLSLKMTLYKDDVVQTLQFGKITLQRWTCAKTTLCKDEPVRTCL